MDTSNLVSILVLSYNNLQYIKDCLNSILLQDYAYIEIIVSDDSSIDFNKTDIEEYIKSNNKGNIINYIINQNPYNYGTVKNLNTAINLATGNYFVNLACDDLLFDNQVISNIVKFFSITNYLIAAGYIAMYDEQLKEHLLTSPTWQYIKYTYGNPLDCYKKLCEGNFIPGPGVSYKRELIERYGNYDENYILLEDYPRWLYLTRNGCSIGFFDKFIVKYRNGGMSNNKDSKANIIYKKDLDLVKEKEIIPFQASL